MTSMTKILVALDMVIRHPLIGALFQIPDKMTTNHDKVALNRDKVPQCAYAAHLHKQRTVIHSCRKTVQTVTKLRFCHSL